MTRSRIPAIVSKPHKCPDYRHIFVIRQGQVSRVALSLTDHADLLCFLWGRNVRLPELPTNHTSMSTTLVKVQHKKKVTMRSGLRQQAGIAEGDMLEATLQLLHIVLRPKVVIEHSAFPNHVDEYTPAQ